MKTKVEQITPAMAREYLKRNTHNRSVRQKAVERYAQDMKLGNWILTHQGIAFDENGNLIDGQHRLLAIIEAGVTVQMLVTFGIQVSQNNGIELFTQDMIDGMKARTPADNLQLNHGIQNASKVVSSVNVIANICASVRSTSTAQAIALTGIYGNNIGAVIEGMSGFKPGGVAPVIGTLSFCAHSHPKEVSAFVTQLAIGEGIKRGQPVLALRNFLINGGPVNRTWTQQKSTLIESVANAMYNTIAGEDIKVIKRGVNGLNFFRSKQRANVEKVRLIIGLSA